MTVATLLNIYLCYASLSCDRTPASVSNQYVRSGTLTNCPPNRVYYRDTCYCIPSRHVNAFERVKERVRLQPQTYRRFNMDCSRVFPTTTASRIGMLNHRPRIVNALQVVNRFSPPVQASLPGAAFTVNSPRSVFSLDSPFGNTLSSSLHDVPPGSVQMKLNIVRDSGSTRNQLPLPTRSPLSSSQSNNVIETGNTGGQSPRLIGSLVPTAQGNTIGGTGRPGVPNLQPIGSPLSPSHGNTVGGGSGDSSSGPGLPVSQGNTITRVGDHGNQNSQPINSLLPASPVNIVGGTTGVRSQNNIPVGPISPTSLLNTIGNAQNQQFIGSLIPTFGGTRGTGIQNTQPAGSLLPISPVNPVGNQQNIGSPLRTIPVNTISRGSIQQPIGQLPTVPAGVGNPNQQPFRPPFVTSPVNTMTGINNRNPNELPLGFPLPRTQQGPNVPNPTTNVRQPLISPLPTSGQQPISSLPTLGQQPISPLPTSGRQPISLLPTLGQQPISPLPTSGQQPISPLPTSGRQPISPLPTSGRQPISPLPTSGRQPISPLPTLGQQPISPLPTFGQQPISPLPTSGQQPISPLPTLGQQPISPLPTLGQQPSVTLPTSNEEISRMGILNYLQLMSRHLSPTQLVSEVRKFPPDTLFQIAKAMTPEQFAAMWHILTAEQRVALYPIKTPEMANLVRRQTSEESLLAFAQYLTMAQLMGFSNKHPELTAVPTLGRGILLDHNSGSTPINFGVLQLPGSNPRPDPSTGSPIATPGNVIGVGDKQPFRVVPNPVNTDSQTPPEHTGGSTGVTIFPTSGGRSGIPSGSGQPIPRGGSPTIPSGPVIVTPSPLGPYEQSTIPGDVSSRNDSEIPSFPSSQLTNQPGGSSPVIPGDLPGQQPQYISEGSTTTPSTSTGTENQTTPYQDPTTTASANPDLTVKFPDLSIGNPTSPFAPGIPSDPTSTLSDQSTGLTSPSLGLNFADISAGITDRFTQPPSPDTTFGNTPLNSMQQDQQKLANVLRTSILLEAFKDKNDYKNICDTCNQNDSMTCYFPYKKSCSVFFMCVPDTDYTLIPQPMQCNVGLFWDQEQRTCNNMSLVTCNISLDPNMFPTVVVAPEEEEPGFPKAQGFRMGGTVVKLMAELDKPIGSRPELAIESPSDQLTG